jgi:hypothetical protein
MKKRCLFMLVICVSLLLNFSVGIAAEKKIDKKSEFVTQGEFMADLVTTLGWDGGLMVKPDAKQKPRERDLLAILSGNRSFKFEAEDYYGVKTDNVSVRKYALFGPFTGSGWVSGVAMPTTAHFRIFLPISGVYSFTVAAKGDGQKWTIGGKEFTVSTGAKISEAKVADVSLNAGFQEITVVIPAEGAIDYLLLDAPTLRAIEPVNGWRPKEELTKGELAEVTAVLLGLESKLPDDGRKSVVSAADVAALPPTAKVTTVDYLGKPVGKKWIRAAYPGALIEIPFTVEKEGLYHLRLHALGDTIKFGIDADKAIVGGKPYLDWVDLGDYRLTEGAHTVRADLKVQQGVDALELIGKKSSPADYLAVSGFTGDAAVSVQRTELDKILASLAERFKERK